MKIAYSIYILLAILALAGCSGDSTQGSDQTNKPAPLTEQVLLDSRITLIEQGHTTAVIDAKYIEKRFGEKNTYAKNISACFYDSLGNIASWLWADSGEVNEKTNRLDVFGNVRVTSKDSIKLFTESLSWDQSINSVVTEDFVEIRHGDNVIYGYGLVTDRTLKEYTIKRQVSGNIKNLPGKKEE